MTDTQLVLDRLAPQTRQTDASMSVMERLLKHHQVGHVLAAVDGTYLQQ